MKFYERAQEEYEAIIKKEKSNSQRILWNGEKAYLVWGEKKYRLNHPDHGGTIPSRQLRQIANGDYGPLVKAIYEAQAKIGVPHRFAWTGIANELGDFTEVLPPTKPKPV